MNYSHTVEFLHSLQVFGARFGLETTRRLAALAGNPHERLRFIHVAGTNGKGSTCAMLESIYRHAGLRVGLFTSPHLVSFAERIQVDRELISEADVARLVEDIQPWMKEFPSEQHPTFFEVVTVMALRWFAEQRCDLVIWETGLGGRLDATNIVTPLASVITNIGWDHQQWLGDSLDKIAAEKAGIIKPGIPVITAAQKGPGLEVIEETARRLRAPLTWCARDAIHSAVPTPASMPGEHQRANAALASATVKALATMLPVAPDAIGRGIATVHWPGRFQMVQIADHRTIVLDGAHNPDGAAALRDTWQRQFPGRSAAMILGVLADKDWQGIAQQLAPLAARILAVPVNSQRTLAPAGLLPACHAANPRAVIEECSSLAEALERSRSEPLLLITGSLYLVGGALERLGLSTAPPGDERQLNEWTVRGEAAAQH